MLVAQLHLNLVTLWIAAHQDPLSMGFSRQGYWSRLLFPFPGDLPDPGIKPGSSALQADSLLTELGGKPWHSPSGQQLQLQRPWGRVYLACLRNSEETKEADME